MKIESIMCKCGHTLGEHHDYHGEPSYCHGDDCGCDKFVCDAPRQGESMTATENPWIPVSERLPEDGVEVETKIHDAKGERNEQTLVRDRTLWFFPDRTMYVYYTPTHWRPLS